VPHYVPSLRGWRLSRRGNLAFPPAITECLLCYVYHQPSQKHPLSLHRQRRSDCQSDLTISSGAIAQHPGAERSGSNLVLKPSMSARSPCPMQAPLPASGRGRGLVPLSQAQRAKARAACPRFTKCNLVPNAQNGNEPFYVEAKEMASESEVSRLRIHRLSPRTRRGDRRSP
jgi:hypothetical protein